MSPAVDRYAHNITSLQRKYHPGLSQNADIHSLPQCVPIRHHQAIAGLFVLISRYCSILAPYITSHDSRPSPFDCRDPSPSPHVITAAAPRFFNISSPQHYAPRRVCDDHKRPCRISYHPHNCDIGAVVRPPIASMHVNSLYHRPVSSRTTLHITFYILNMHQSKSAYHTDPSAIPAHQLTNRCAVHSALQFSMQRILHRGFHW